MKFSISVPENVGKEIKALAKQTERSVSWWIQRAWLAARTEFMDRKVHDQAAAKALERLDSLRGVLKKYHPNTSSVELAHRAFRKS